jgi:hypothetical protein
MNKFPTDIHDNYPSNQHPTDAGYQAFRILQMAFVIVPIMAGLDKFFYFLNDWRIYISPVVFEVIAGYSTIFMYVVGIIEISIGIGIIFKPKFFAYVAGVWLLLIIINLLILGKYFDVALHDFGLMLSAFALGRASQKYE